MTETQQPAFPCPFFIGQYVERVEYTDGYGQFHPAEPGLIVHRVRYVTPTNPKSPYAIEPYWRIYAAIPGVSFDTIGADSGRFRPMFKKQVPMAEFLASIPK